MERFDKADLSLLVRKPHFEFNGLSRLSRDVKLRSAESRIDLSLLSTVEQVDESEATEHDEGDEVSEAETHENSAENKYYLVDKNGDKHGDFTHVAVVDAMDHHFDLQALLRKWRRNEDKSLSFDHAEMSVNHGDRGFYDVPDPATYVDEVRVSKELPHTPGHDRQLGQGIRAFQMFLTGENRLESGSSALQIFESRQTTFPNRIGGNEMFVTYTISEDRSDDSGGLQTTRLAALNNRTKTSNPSGNDHEEDDLSGRFWSPDPLLHDLDEPYRQRLLMYVKEEGAVFRCLVPSCESLFATKEEWADHVDYEHEHWNDTLRDDFGLPPLPVDEAGLNPDDLDEIQRLIDCGRRKAVRTLKQHNNDIYQALAFLNPGESAMEEVD